MRAFTIPTRVISITYLINHLVYTREASVEHCKMSGAELHHSAA